MSGRNEHRKDAVKVAMRDIDCSMVSSSARRRRRVGADPECWTSAALVIGQIEEHGNSCRLERGQWFSSSSCGDHVNRSRGRISQSKLLRAKSIICGCLLGVSTVTAFSTCSVARVRPPLRSGRLLFWFDETGEILDPEGRGSRRGGRGSNPTDGCGCDDRRRATRIRQREGWSRGVTRAPMANRGSSASWSACHMSAVMEPPPMSAETREVSSSLSRLERSARLPASPLFQPPDEVHSTRSRGKTIVRRIPFLNEDR